MVCVSPEDRVGESEARVQCIVRYIDFNSSSKEKYEGTFPASTDVRDLIDAVAAKFNINDPSLIRLNYQSAEGSLIFTIDTEGTLGTIGLNTDYGARNSMVLEIQKSPKGENNKRRFHPRSQAPDSDVITPPPPPLPLPGASADVTLPTPNKFHTRNYSRDSPSSSTRGYVGLVNQAMTCYLNSLLQALFMTPEFRNALYKWKFDPSQRALPQKCIPYQLQKLFLNLQTSDRTAVETTELTRSFGWESGEVWQQHDIQELCRVMFDALENEFKHTEQADLINHLYQGKMIDYVKCLECGTEKSKEDVFLDIPLPVRPFGSTVAYKDIDEALKAFVLPETLNENNQYFCEACNKKCDAHKGLKFSKFPYLLTLHLKRFDFDYNIMHRIKLNDKVTFPEILDLNAFIQNSETPPEENLDVTIKCDDSSTTDSALDEETNHVANEAPVFEADQSNFATDVGNNQDDDEGIDLSNNSNNSMENEKNINQSLSKGPFVYELYSIMIHSGSASGGHYYAYIKDFTRGEWFCFNDQLVSPITRDDIVKTYGGGPHRMYYNGAHSSSTNAYMLMYRQIDKNQNCQAMTTNDFPLHIQKILEEIKESEERERALKAKEEEMVKLKVYCNHPGASQRSIKVFIHYEDTLENALSLAYSQLKLESVIPEEQCRLVSYDKTREYLELSFEGREKNSIKDILSSTEKNSRGMNMEFLLETREKNKKFFPYNCGDISMIVYLVDLENCDVTSATYLRTSPCQTVADLKEFFQEAIPLESKDIHLAYARNNSIKYLPDREARSSSPRPLNRVGFFSENRVFITPALPEDGDLSVNFEKSRFYKCVFELWNVILLQLSLPENMEDQCDSLLIPLLDLEALSKEASETSSDSVDAGQRLNGIEEELAYSGASGTSDQSASEDSSLTDSERTIIGDTEVGTNDGRVSSGSDSEQLFSPVQSTPNVATTEEEGAAFVWNNDSISNSPKPAPNLYFRAELITEVVGAPTPMGEQRVLKVAVDRNMDMETFKTKLERYVGVAGKYLKIFQAPDSRSEVTSFFQNKDNDKIAIGLNRHLEKDEFRAKLYYLNTNYSKNQSQQNPVELIICKERTVGDTKKDIAKELAKKGWKAPVDRIRLRMKEWKSPGKILLDGIGWEELIQQDSIELFFQNLDGPEKVNANTFLVAFTRRWHPSTMTLGPFAEVVLDHPTEFLKRLSEMSALAVENIEFAKGSSIFPCEMNVLNINDLEWTTNEEILVEWKQSSFGCALVIFYRDKNEELKSLTKEEEDEMAQSESSNLPNSSSPYISSYSPRKERALKIYWDNKPAGKIMDLD
uniref:Ubiquitin carboxyl-terminal hydrolase 47 n=2 Tax=Lygus hesperus TaxID=30085 RepID=A0A0K8SRZ2_LYGHE